MLREFISFEFGSCSSLLFGMNIFISMNCWPHWGRIPPCPSIGVDTIKKGYFGQKCQSYRPKVSSLRNGSVSKLCCHRRGVLGLNLEFTKFGGLIGWKVLLSFYIRRTTGLHKRGNNRRKQEKGIGKRCDR